MAFAVAIHCRLPDGIVRLHHTQRLADRQAVERSAEGAEARLIVRPGDQRDSLVMRALCLGREVEPRLVLEMDRIEALELDRSRLGGLAGEPDRPLARARGIVDAADQVPGE